MVIQFESGFYLSHTFFSVLLDNFLILLLVIFFFGLTPLYFSLKSLIYGEVEFESFYRVLRKINPEPGLIFYDLGSGTSKVRISKKQGILCDNNI